MTPQELAARAKAYVDQAVERYTTVAGQVMIPEAATGEWVSLRANLVSAQTDLDTLVRGA